METCALVYLTLDLLYEVVGWFRFSRICGTRRVAKKLDGFGHTRCFVTTALKCGEDPL